MLDQAQQALADYVGTGNPGEIAFGANMTTLTFALSRALSKVWGPGDEVLVTRLDDDANVSPWVLAARDAGATARQVEIRWADCTLDLDDLRNKHSRRTKLVAASIQPQPKMNLPFVLCWYLPRQLAPVRLT